MNLSGVTIYMMTSSPLVNVSTFCYSYIYIDVLSSVWCDLVTSNLILIDIIFWSTLLSVGSATQHSLMKFCSVEFDIKWYT